MKKLFFALCAAILTICFIWCLQVPLHDLAMELPPAAGVPTLVFGVGLIMVGFILLLRWLGRVASRWGFTGFSPSFLFAMLFYFTLIDPLLPTNPWVEIPKSCEWLHFDYRHGAWVLPLLMGIYAGGYFFYPGVVRCEPDRRLAYWQFWLTVAGLWLGFAVVHYHEYGNDSTQYLDWQYRLPRFVWSMDWIDYENLVSLLLLVVALLVFLFNLAYSALRGKTGMRR